MGLVNEFLKCERTADELFFFVFLVFSWSIAFPCRVRVVDSLFVTLAHQMSSHLDSQNKVNPVTIYSQLLTFLFIEGKLHRVVAILSHNYRLNSRIITFFSDKQLGLSASFYFI